MRTYAKFTAMAAVAALSLAAPADAQRATEFGIDAGALFGLGDQSSIDIALPGARFRVGFFTPGSRISLEPAAALSYSKVEGGEGSFGYNLEMGALYHFSPIVAATENTARVTSPYVRPFIGIDGFSAGDVSESEVSIGAGLGTKIPWRRDLSLRFEANIGYGFDREAVRLGVLAGLSFFPR